MILSEILRVFSLPIKEEQAWAVCYFSAKILADLVEKGIKVNYLSEANLAVEENGDVKIIPNSSRDLALHDLSEAELIEALGVLLVKALNYGLHPDHPLAISTNLDSLLLHMTSTMSHDEGVVASVLSFEDVISACSNRISSESQRCDSHYNIVCRALVAEATELSSFLDRVGGCGNDDDNILQRGDWARIWLSIMSELRHGVKLKHMENRDPSGSHAPVFEMTPFEVLLADIRSQRFRLNPVMVNGDIPQSVRKTAESLIFDFIKSRPPLKAPPSQPTKKYTRPATARELLMNAIKNNEFQLRPVAPKTLSTSSRNTSSSHHHQHQRRRVIRIDRSRISADSDPEDAGDSSTNSSTPTAPNPNAILEEDLPNIKALIINPQIKKLRTVAMTRSRSLSPPPDVGSRLEKLNRQQTVAEKSAPDDYEPEIQMEHPSVATYQKSPLTFEELTRIRAVLTAAELEQLAVCPNVQSDVASGNVCFACRKVRFNLISWSIRCRLCGWKVCQKCTIPCVSLPGFDRGVPVCCDCHELLEMINNPKSPSSSISPSESTVQTAPVDSASSRRLSGDQRCL